MKKIYFFGLIVFVLLLGACSGNNENSNTEEAANSSEESGVELGEKDLTIPYVAWARETVVSHLLGEVLVDIGYNVDVKQVETGPMWASVADGSADFTASAWLPDSQKEYRSEERRSEEHTSELQSRGHLVCRLLLEKKNNQ